MATETKWVIVVPGKVAFVTPGGREKFTNIPKPVLWNSYLQELLVDQEDIIVVDPTAKAAEPVQTRSSAVKA